MNFLSLLESAARSVPIYTPAFEAVAFRVTGPEPQIELSRALYPRDHDSGTRRNLKSCLTSRRIFYDIAGGL
jgi:hypothetical protein